MSDSSMHPSGVGYRVLVSGDVDGKAKVQSFFVEASSESEARENVKSRLYGWSNPRIEYVVQVDAGNGRRREVSAKRSSSQSDKERFSITDTINRVVAFICIVILVVAWCIPSSSSDSSTVFSLFDFFTSIFSDIINGIIVCVICFVGPILSGFGEHKSTKLVGHALSLVVFCVSVYTVSSLPESSEDMTVSIPGAIAMLIEGIIELIWFLFTCIAYKFSDRIDVAFNAYRGADYDRSMTNSYIKRLSALNVLYDGKLISDEEYQKKRGEIIEGL